MDVMMPALQVNQTRAAVSKMVVMISPWIAHGADLREAITGYSESAPCKLLLLALAQRIVREQNGLTMRRRIGGPIPCLTSLG